MSVFRSPLVPVLVVLMARAPALRVLAAETESQVAAGAMMAVAHPEKRREARPHAEGREERVAPVVLKVARRVLGGLTAPSLAEAVETAVPAVALEVAVNTPTVR